MKRANLAWLTALLALSALAAVVTLFSRGAVRIPARAYTHCCKEAPRGLPSHPFSAGLLQGVASLLTPRPLGCEAHRRPRLESHTRPTQVSASGEGSRSTSLLGGEAGGQGLAWQELTMLDAGHHAITDYTLEVRFGLVRSACGGECSRARGGKCLVSWSTPCPGGRRHPAVVGVDG